MDKHSDSNKTITITNTKPEAIIASLKAAKPGPGLSDDLLYCASHKPVQPTILKDSLLSSEVTTHRKITSESERVTMLSFNAKILLVEDNPVNQIIVNEILSELGYKVEIVENGQLAYEACQKYQYRIVFMDQQMPVMDGSTATRLIREWEGSNSIKPTQIIIAMTANTMEGDRERFLANGMDDYLSKPFNQNDIARILSRWLETSEITISPDTNQGEVGIPCLDILDKDILLKLQRRYAHKSPERFNDLIKIYLESTNVILDELALAIEKEDAELIRLHAHSIKSSCLHFGALRLSTHFKEMETFGREHNLKDIKKLFEIIILESDQVASELSSLMTYQLELETQN